MKTILLLLTPFYLFSQIENSDKHKIAGTIITVGTSEFLQYKYVKPKYAITIGLGLGVLAGATKELVYDKLMKRGNPDKFDFFDTSWGSLCACAVCIPLSQIRIAKRKIYEKN